jgi:hypothetical protein
MVCVADALARAKLPSGLVLSGPVMSAATAVRQAACLPCQDYVHTFPQLVAQHVTDQRSSAGNIL